MIGDLLPAAWKEAKKQGLPESLFTYELFAGQVEDRTLPCDSLVDLRMALEKNDEIIFWSCQNVGR